MNTDFWLERWSKHEIGFHQSQVNEYLRDYWPRLNIAPGATVFVPLCGKTLDMRWLHELGHRVIGIEIARNACSEFFQEWNVVPEVTRDARFERWEANGITLLCGDFFDLRRDDLDTVTAVFDRAALIALPPDLRKAYANKLREILPSQATILLIAPDYDQHEMNGPPFAVSRREIDALFAGWSIEELAAVNVTNAPDNARFLQRGLTKLVERVFRIGHDR